ncbi:hypothetical protein PACTADRAFT_52071 [Pachysolen tannophilus NRRL Y-2460]|uniref:Peptidase S8/S53 domain-containing protein n=1 Tax=Pachysolen tannophilus NRRL Y-2460 TaxID=669874 RepID=A0A1E4TP07_PACTA|nr:hypothetical protein PACTADRAFT_52071 [Pachysolen tannophilus NRRL Y-2460]
MKLTNALALSILSALSSYALVIPNLDELPSVMNLNTPPNKAAVAKDDAKDAADIGASVKAGTESNNDKAVDPYSKMNLFDDNSKASAPLFSAETQGRKVIPHSYIIVLKQGLTPEQINFHREWVKEKHSNFADDLLNKDPNDPFFISTQEQGVDKFGGLMDEFNISNLINGYSGFFLDQTVELIRKNPMVAFVEKNTEVHANEFSVQNGAPWGLARVSHRDSLNLGSFNKYLFDDNGGEGVTAYVIDTGVHVSHKQFGSRAKWGKTIPTGDADEDDNGHGTHCAGTIGSDDYGIAKKANIVAVKVLRSNGSGSASDVIKGIEYAANSHLAAEKENKKGFKGSTANMSLGGGKSAALDLAVNAAVKAGLHFAVAAGNENQDACNTSPGGAEKVITVGASTLSDARAYFSNYGKCVDIFAPGLNILSTYIGSDTATATLSGTSMASPHICGLLSYFLSLQPGSDSEFFNGASSGITPDQLKKNLIAFASEGVLSDIPEDTPNLLVFNGAGQNLSSFWDLDGKSVESMEKQHLVDVDRIVKDVKDSVNFEKAEEKIVKIMDEVKDLIDDLRA